jgi:acyl-CoA synthetase (AMP-forming)/AMP-acid ligase II
MTAHLEAAPQHLVALLRARAIEGPDRLAVSFLDTDANEIDRATYGELDARARALAVELCRVAPSGARVLVLCPPGVGFVTAFFASLYAGCVAVPAYPVLSKKDLPKLSGVVADAGVTAAIATRELASMASQALTGGRVVIVEDCNVDAAADWREPAVESDSVAFLQYTSGSTRTPRGVIVRHSNAIANQRIVARAFGHDPKRTIMASWLPLYHDMGLGSVVQAMYLGTRIYLLSPWQFLQRPIAWLRAVSRYRITTSGGPSFAYELAARRSNPAQREGLDLSSWEVAFNGAEPVRAEVIDRFVETFGPHGFRREAFYPCYGLAECVVFASGGEPGKGPVTRYVDRAALEHSTIRPAAEEDARARALIGCGSPGPDHGIVIVDPASGTPCEPGQVGEIWVTGPSVAEGYWGRTEETDFVFGATLPGDARRFLRTGDLGFFERGELFITGRAKDLVIVRGQNHYAEDIERTVEDLGTALRPGGCAAFGIEQDGEERLVVVGELRPADTATIDRGALAVDVREAVARAHRLSLHALVLVKAGSVPKTSSGKVQRNLCRARFLEGTLTSLEGGS